MAGSDAELGSGLTVIRDYRLWDICEKNPSLLVECELDSLLLLLSTQTEPWT